MMTLRGHLFNHGDSADSVLATAFAPEPGGQGNLIKTRLFLAWSSVRDRTSGGPATEPDRLKPGSVRSWHNCAPTACDPMCLFFPHVKG